DCDRETELVAEMYDVSKPQNYLPDKLRDQTSLRMEPGNGQWATLKFGAPRPESPRNAFLVLRANEHVAVHISDQSLPGTLLFHHREPDADDPNGLYFREWKRTLHRKSICFQLVDR